jgi:exodeoxyribonuclease-3
MDKKKSSLFKIATWNVNSLKVRLGHVLQWLEEEKPDVLALQEIKMENKNFPEEAFKSAGYHAVFNGQKTYNGVAILSRFLPAEIEMPDPDAQHRIVSATIENIRVINIYVPNGESTESLKYPYKLNWLLQFKEYVSAQLTRYPRLIVLGDFNVAPADEDVHDPLAWQGKVLCSEAERQALQNLLQTGLTDSFRLFPQAPKSYSWWDYRMLGFQRNKGMRIDHIFISEQLKSCCKACLIDKNPRKWERPSDHTPVIACFETC